MAEKEYIEREAALKRNYFSESKTPDENYRFNAEIKFCISSLPAADVVPVRHAKWAYGKLHGQSGYYCSECGAGFSDINPNAELIAKSHDYCPKCGAKMDGGDENAQSL